MNRFEQILTKYWGYPKFRPLQEDIIRSVVDEKKDTLGLLPTGGGKSVIFQVPALAQEGICIVITPLIALMKDQVDNLQKIGVKALAIYSGMSKDEIDIALNNCIYGDFKFLYCSPERLSTEMFQARVIQMRVNLIAIDEAHCISQWGYDFRPSYLQIAKIRNLLPNIPILALTATATPDVVEDIQEKLKFKEKNLFQKSFERKNLIYIVRKVDDKYKYLLKIVNKMPETGIVYVRNRKRTREIAEFLKSNNINADYYHAGLKHELKDYKQNEWKAGRCRVIVSTNAFGMGIDKSDVRFVVHMDLPDSLEAYFQEAGRGGRDGKTAFAVVLYNENDIQKLEKAVETSYPPKDTIKKVYNALCNYLQIPVGSGKGLSTDFKLTDFASNYHFSFLTIHNSLKILQREGYLEVTEELNNPSQLRFIINRQDLYKFQVANSAFDNFIKLILRSYTGIFSEYAKIDEDMLAKKAKTTRDTVYKYLVKLSKMKIIKYIPQKKTPLVIFTEERLDEKALFLSKEKYQGRKENYQKKINAVIRYVSSTSKCRSRLLLEYFGETETYRCGKCDVCKRRNELSLSRYEFDLILEKIKTKLRKEAMTPEEIVAYVPEKKEDKVLKVVQWLLDNNKIRYEKDLKLKWA
ncbi:MAG: recombinase RecQ [Bacteroidia bacterium]|nr:MAG: recombinase RecQ [Bacteroidia bacterium]